MPNPTISSLTLPVKNPNTGVVTNVTYDLPSGGSGGGHTIENSTGTDLAQRDTLQFGEGFLAADDSTNEKTVVSPDVMQSGDMADVITPLPTVAIPPVDGIKYSTTEQVVGEWIDGKPVYQRSYELDITANEQNFPHGIANLGTVIEMIGTFRLYDGGYFYLHLGYINPSGNQRINAFVGGTNIGVRNTGASSGKLYLTIQYTKTTD